MSELEIQNPSTKRIDNSRLDAMRGGENVLLGDEGGAAELSRAARSGSHHCRQPRVLGRVSGAAAHDSSLELLCVHSAG